MSVLVVDEDVGWIRGTLYSQGCMYGSTLTRAYRQTDIHIPVPVVATGPAEEERRTARAASILLARLRRTADRDSCRSIVGARQEVKWVVRHGMVRSVLSRIVHIRSTPRDACIHICRYIQYLEQVLDQRSKGVGEEDAPQVQTPAPQGAACSDCSAGVCACNSCVGVWGCALGL